MNAPYDIYDATKGLFLGYATLALGLETKGPTKARTVLSGQDIARLCLAPDSLIEARPAPDRKPPPVSEPPRLCIQIFLRMTCIHGAQMLHEALDYLGQPEDGSLLGYRFGYTVQPGDRQQIEIELQEFFDFQQGLPDADRTLVDWIRLVGAVRLVAGMELEVNMHELDLHLE
jgi:hypothetical protein